MGGGGYMLLAVRMLVGRRVDIAVKDNDGSTAFDVAMSSGRQEIARLLKQQEGNTGGVSTV